MAKFRRKGYQNYILPSCQCTLKKNVPKTLCFRFKIDGPDQREKFLNIGFRISREESKGSGSRIYSKVILIFLVSGLHFILTVRIGGDKWLPSSVNDGGAGKIERQLWKCSLVFFTRYKRPLQFDKKMSNLLNLLHQNSELEKLLLETFLFTEINYNQMVFLPWQGRKESWLKSTKLAPTLLAFLKYPQVSSDLKFQTLSVPYLKNLGF